MADSSSQLRDAFESAIEAGLDYCAAHSNVSHYFTFMTLLKDAAQALTAYDASPPAPSSLMEKFSLAALQPTRSLPQAFTNTDNYDDFPDRQASHIDNITLHMNNVTEILNMQALRGRLEAAQRGISVALPADANIAPPRLQVGGARK